MPITLAVIVWVGDQVSFYGDIERGVERPRDIGSEDQHHQLHQASRCAPERGRGAVTGRWRGWAWHDEPFKARSPHRGCQTRCGSVEGCLRLGLR